MLAGSSSSDDGEEDISGLYGTGPATKTLVTKLLNSECVCLYMRGGHWEGLKK